MLGRHGPGGTGAADALRKPLVADEAAPNHDGAPPRRFRAHAALVRAGLAVSALGVAALLAIGLAASDARWASPFGSRLRSAGADASPFAEASHPLQPSAEWGNVSFPYPTNAWWTNLVVSDDMTKPGGMPVVPLPYAVRARDGRGMEVSYGPTRRSVTPQFEGDYFGADLVIGTAGTASAEWGGAASEGMAGGAVEQSYSHSVVSSSVLTLGVAFTGSSAPSERFVARLARGAPWVVTEWSGATPHLSSDFAITSVRAVGGAHGGDGKGASGEGEEGAGEKHGHAGHKGAHDAHAHGATAAAPAAIAAVDPLCSAHTECAVLEASVADGLCCPLTVNHIMLECCNPPPAPPVEEPPKPPPEREGGGGTLRAARLFELKLQTGATWLLAFESKVVLSWQGVPAQLQLAEGYEGAMRLAFAHDRDSALALAALASGPYAIDGAVRIDEDEDGSGATLAYEWKVRADGSSADDLVTLALPHHVAALDAGTVMRDGPKFDSIKGTLTPIRGRSWSVREQYANISWFAPRKLDAALEPSVRSALQLDLADPLVLVPDAKDPYGFGKQAGRLARLILIAEELGETHLLRTATSALVLALEPWLLGENPAPWPNAPPGSGALVYDTTYGGLLSNVGLHDAGADFGNGRYNDHHFQYGYLLYAAAVACRNDASFCARHKAAIGDIIRDIANPPSADGGGAKARARFPVARCKDLYDGHSWASGLFPMADGKSQESSSEAVNGYYGAMLAADAMGDAQLGAWARLLLATEVRAAQWYWHVPSASAVYDPAFVASQRMVGVVGATDVVVGTWFGAELEYVHGINIMPITPFTEALLPAAYVAEEYAQLSARAGQMQDAWAGFAVAAHAILNPTRALSELGQLKFFDNGNSRTNMLHWIGTRPAPPSSVLGALSLLRSPSAVHAHGAAEAAGTPGA